ncbi:STAS domain-containing protein [Nonomuraea sp. NPDC046570]|uniref:STAS domain-containing protein n=1 Tax=Nonomuraea sp. NPDC046570 TaxID=3155255 RepID=UPI00340DA877
MLDRTPLRIEVLTADATTVQVALSGDLDYVTVAQLSALTLAPGYRSLDMDLSGLLFIDSSGLAALIRLANVANAEKASFRVTALTPYLRNLLRMTALDQLFNVPRE